MTAPAKPTCAIPERQKQKRRCRRKQRFRWSHTAIRTAEARKRENGAPPLRVYLCPICDYWHLTSQQPDTPRTDDARE